MADWRKLSLALTLADGKIDDAEVKILRKELYADGKVDSEEVGFLIELRNQAQKKAKGKKMNANFEKLFFKALEANVLADGSIDAAEAALLRKVVFADKKIDANEKKFLSRLKKAARSVSAEFDKLCSDCKVK